MDSEIRHYLAEWISERRPPDFRIRQLDTASGGCIHQSYVLKDGDRAFFVKVNDARQSALFEAEAEALEALRATKTFHIPEPIGYGETGSESFLVMDCLRFGRPKKGSWEAMGRTLAELHRCSHPQFGWPKDNFIGANPQHNHPTEQWSEFFCQQRLQPQLTMARQQGIQISNPNALLESVERCLDPHNPEPALLHGDLWSGNVDFLESGEPVLYDPACYYGDREADLAFSEFFGGFPNAFYEAYEATWPLPPGYPQRKKIYNLYHLLNHANLFGGSYITQVQREVDQIIRQY